MPSGPAATPGPHVLFPFNANGLVLLARGVDGAWEPWLTAAGDAPDFAGRARDALAAAAVGGDAKPVGEAPGGERVWFAYADELEETPAGGGAGWLTLAELARVAEEPGGAAPGLRSLLPFLRRECVRVPYLNFGENEYIYRFRTEKQRNRAVYQLDERARSLYQSALCEAIKRLKRTKERASDSPAELDFGAVRYVLPSHFGFCLGVQNAIERAYETIAENPGRRVFMLSELIHNPFVNDDLVARGLRYLQTDKGRPLTNPATGASWWDELTARDIVIIPAFGATDDDKRRLIERGIALNRYDATCMLVEKVWKAARRYGQLGYTVIIHGKHEHEETKATFSNSAKYAPSLILRDRHEAEALAAIMLAPNPDEVRRRFDESFAGRASEGFDPARHLDRVAVVNQTTLLRNETIAIIDLLEGTLARKFGAERVGEHLFAESRGDTLCYATQVNQDALGRALDLPLDAAVVVGGKNSSNTYQLFRLCEARHGRRAFYIQSERNILGRQSVEHFIYPYAPGDPRQGRYERREFLPAAKPVRILLTGGASCPDGLIQQIIARVNSFFPAEELRPIEAVLTDLGGGAA